MEREEKMLQEMQSEEKMRTLKEKQAKSRDKVRKIKETLPIKNTQEAPPAEPKPRVGK